MYKYTSTKQLLLYKVSRGFYTNMLSLYKCNHMVCNIINITVVIPYACTRGKVISFIVIVVWKKSPDLENLVRQKVASGQWPRCSKWQKMTNLCF